MPLTQAREICSASRLNNVRYAIRDLACVADEVTKQGHKVLPLNIGDPLSFDFETPAHIIEAVHKAMLDGKNGYAPSEGVHEALEAIRGEAARKGITTVRDVFVTSGVSETVDVCLSGLVNPGEDFLTPSPDYPLYSAVLCKLGNRLNAYDLNEEDGWQPELADIERKISPGTRGIVIINPNNPTGSLCTRQMLEQIAELARRHSLIVFSDEIYDKLILDGTPHIAFASVAPDVPCVTFGGMSKNYLVPGWRIGWGIVSGDAGTVKTYTEGVHRLLRARLCAQSSRTVCNQSRARRPARSSCGSTTQASFTPRSHAKMVRSHTARKLCNAARSILCVPAHRYPRERRGLRQGTHPREARHGSARLRFRSKARHPALPYCISSGRANIDESLCGDCAVYRRQVWERLNSLFVALDPLPTDEEMLMFRTIQQLRKKSIRLFQAPPRG